MQGLVLNKEGKAMREKTIITAAVTGSIHTPTMSPYLPITPKQIADDAAAACRILGLKGLDRVNF